MPSHHCEGSSPPARSKLGGTSPQGKSSTQPQFLHTEQPAHRSSCSGYPLKTGLYEWKKPDEGARSPLAEDGFQKHHHDGDQVGYDSSRSNIRPSTWWNVARGWRRYARSGTAARENGAKRRRMLAHGPHLPGDVCGAAGSHF